MKRKQEPVVREDLMGRIADYGNLMRAWVRVKADKGSGGIDGETVGAFAVTQVLVPRYERVFSESSYGFRPNRSAHDALGKGSAYVADGYLYVVELDKELERRGHRFCRYADDCNIYVGSQRAGERVMEGITRFITRKLRLKVNAEKSKVAKSGFCKFLGYTMGAHGMLWIATKSKERMTERLKALTSRNRGRKLETVIGNLNTYLRGWLAYYRLASAKVYLRETEAWLRRKLRCCRLKQCKRPYTIAKFLMRNGVPKHRAWLLAGSRKGWYRMSDTPQAAEAMSNEWFVKQGLIPLVLPVG